MNGPASLPEMGQTAEIAIDLSAELVNRFAEFVGDFNPLHMNDDAARELGFPGRVAHGMSYAAFLSTLIGTHLPGPGSLWASQTWRFLAPAHVGDRIILRGEVVEVAAARRSVRLSVEAVNQDGKRVMEGESLVLLPTAKAAQAKAASGPVAALRDQPVALIVGASGDLGAAIASALARQGFAVALGGRRTDKLASLAADLQAEGGIAAAVTIDLMNEESVAAAVETANAQLGPANTVVHCASAPLPGAGPEETDWAVYRLHYELQVGGLHRLLRAATPTMAATGGGQLIYVGSTATHGAPPKGLAAYTAAKAAGASLVRSVAAELGPKGIRGNIVSPHFLATELTSQVTGKMRKLVAAQTPLRRLADVNEIASTVAFLATDQSAYLNGHDLVIDGGAVMR